MALLSRIKSPDWQDGDILTASDLKAEFNNIINGLNGSADISVVGITASGAYSGTSLVLSAAANVGTNLTVSGSAAITGNANAALIHAGAYVPGWIDNLGLSLSSGTLSIVDASGSALTSSNFGWVTCPSTTAGQTVTLKVNAAASIANTATTNFEWGVTSTADWANDLPFFLYVVNKGNNNVTSADGGSCFFLSRIPHMSTTPSSLNSIGDKDAIPLTDAQNSILILASITETDYVSLPCQLVGAVRMRYATSTHIWSVQALGNSDGLGQRQLDKTFSTRWEFPVAQNGAAAGTYILANGGTAPVFTNKRISFTINANGRVVAEGSMSSDGGADGAGAVSTLCALPYLNADSDGIFSCLSFVQSSGSSTQFRLGTISGSASNMGFFDSGGANITLDQFGSGSREITLQVTYLA